MGSQRSVLFVVATGIIFHAIYIMSIFDLYFRSPVVQGMTPGKEDLEAPAKRLVLFVADGLRADKFFEVEGDSHLSFRAPYLRKILETRGAWGVSHTRVPTESRPGHVAMIAGLYEDVSAVTRGWKSNPVGFDSFFNRTSHTWAFGSPDILPMFAIGVPHVHTFMYGAEVEDFKADASRLDTWVFERVKKLFEDAKSNHTLDAELRQSRVSLFLHLLGTDTIGHAAKPQSSRYLASIRLVDREIEKLVDVIEEFYGHDQKTAYVFTSDHGMHDKGSHGDGDPQNTETPLLCWGAGVDGPRQQNFSDVEGFLRLHSDPRWALDHLARRDVQQADIAPLMASLVGVPFPMNSVGRLPYRYLHAADSFKTRKLLENAEQIAQQLHRKSQIRKERSFFFRPFSYSQRVDDLIVSARYHMLREDHALAREELTEAMELTERGLQYFQTYDWPLLMTAVTAGYTGWIVYVVVFFAQRHSSTPTTPPDWWWYSLAVPALLALYFLAQQMPPLYYLYVAFPLFFWTEVLRHSSALLPVLGALRKRPLEWLARAVFLLFVLEVLVLGYFERAVLSCCLLLMSFAYAGAANGANVLWGSSCLATSLFLLLPIDLTLLPAYMVPLGGFVILATIPAYLHWSGSRWNRYWITYVVLLASSLTLVQHTSYCFASHRGLPLFNQLASWAVLVMSTVLLAVAPADNPLDLLVSRFAAMAPPFVLFAVSYEVLFLICYAALLFFWLLNELPSSAEKRHSHTPPFRPGLSFRFMRNTILFIVMCYVALFGTGNIASISSFEVQSCYRFVTVFDPFVMAALIVCKLLLPFVLLTCAYTALNMQTGVSAAEGVLAVVAASDVMSLNFFFLVRDTGSWREIGMSIGHFCIVNSTVIFQLVLLWASDTMLQRIVKQKL